jgi:para-aminobenzoate synthetase component 1
LRTNISFPIDSVDQFKEQLLVWSQQFSHCIWLDSNAHQTQFSEYEALLAVGDYSSLVCDYRQAFDKLEAYLQSTQDWIFGYLSYDLKNDNEALSSSNYDALHFPDLFFFQPKKVFLLKDTLVELHYIEEFSKEVDQDMEAIKAVSIQKSGYQQTPKIKMRIHKDAYFEKVGRLLEHIHRGDIYEANFCQEFYAEDLNLDPLETYRQLNSISRPPFSTYLKMEDRYLLSASPERFLQRNGSKIISQPIKGTARRSTDPEEDQSLKEVLRQDEKERSENIMIVDLVRNDLSHTAMPGTVKVTELCEVYSFLQVHQMISTIEAELKEGYSSIDAIKYAFPMGSMTGAPKISAMNIIEELEETKRGLYSGSVGYFKPNGDFDFNVVIRSILYNAGNHYASFSVGSAITAKSDPQAEYEECLLKAKAMREVLDN